MKESIYNYTKGDITIAVLNTYNTTTIDVSFILDVGSVEALEYDQFLLTSYPGVINSKVMYLNGKQIEMTNGNALPALNPIPLNGGVLKMTPLSYGFVVVKNVNPAACN